MYHDVVPERTRGTVWFDATVDEFRKNMELLKENNITPISLDQLYRHLTKGELIPSPAIVITFDDNYQGVYENAWPILQEFNYPAAVFVHTKFVGDISKGRPKMTYSTLKELVKTGLITVGSHTVTHPDDITQLDTADQKRELNESKAELEKMLGLPIDYLAYPDGKNDMYVQVLAREAGYKMAFSTASGPAEESPTIMAVNRWINTKFEKAIEICDDAAAATGLADITLKNGPITYETGTFSGTKMALIKGGLPSQRKFR